MLRALTWAAILATLLAVVAVLAPSFWSVTHEQALTSLIVGEFAALTSGYTAYRIAYGKEPSAYVGVVSVSLGGVLAASPTVFGFVQPFATVTVVCGAVVAVVGLATLAAVLVTDDERRLPDIGSDPEATEETAETGRSGVGQS